ncbi:TraR/DksA C4-type zinc finger protein [Bacillus changyiensis]|uniref:TraR/DksA C4-type zinc finger protein n=1 Tax=Bacillus changyiensis TaxID=3004103 RepID=UPI0022DFE7E8|nr:TraR/DksA C4-type zinc finger protein [Bacillus changyiensis]MDA1477735.1 TraR/DksA C4-type zinc finger protein [Bacillus changyiensis]
MLTTEQVKKLEKELKAGKEQILFRFKNNGHFQKDFTYPFNSTGDLSAYDNHPGDEGTELYEREKDLALWEHEKEHLHDIEHALSLIEKGTYGRCEVCGKDIPYDRLTVLPTATTCREHSSNVSVSKDRPIEEEVLNPPFGHFERDDEENVAYDSEDAYQEVERYGSSITPQDLAVPPLSYGQMHIEYGEPVGNVEDYENFVATDITGKEVTVYPTKDHEKYEELLDEEGIMTSFGDLPPAEKEPYTEDD